MLAVLAATALLPAAAGAHASLTTTSPPSGAVLDAAPKQVVFTFSEHVEGSFGALQVIDDRGRRVDDGRVVRPAGRDDQLAIGIRSGTGRGAYAATYRVISADGHPVVGGETFVVGRGVTAAPPDVGALTAREGAPAGVGTALSAARVVRYLGIGGATGLLVLVLVVWAPLRGRATVTAEADEAFVRAAGRALRGVAVVGVVGSLAALVLQAAFAGATGVGDALRPSVLGDVIGTRTGAWFLATAVASLVLAVLARRVVARSADRGVVVAAVLLVVLLVVAPALGGHAAASSPAWALVPIQIVHVAGMGTWLGGLLGLLLVLPRATRTLPEGRPRHALQAAVLMRFSPVALVSVGVLTLAGTGLAILHLTTLYDLTDTAYGRAIFVKVALLVGAIWVAVLQREYLLPRLRRLADGEAPAPEKGAADDDGPQTSPTGSDVGDDDEPRAAPSAATGRHVRLALRAEVTLLVAVLAATGALAGYAPPKSLDPGPVSVSRTVGSVQLRLTVDPARVGSNGLQLYVLGRDEQPVGTVEELTARAVPPGRAGGSDVPVAIPFVKTGRGHWTAASVPFGTRGGWTVDVTFRTSAFDQAESKLPVRIR